MKITCDIIGDLMSLYIDDVCTEDTKEAVEEHIKKCSSCRTLFENMSAEIPIFIPEKTEAELAKKPFKKLRLRFIFWLFFAMLCTAVIVFTLQAAGVFHSIEMAFYHNESFVVENAEKTDEWVTVTKYMYFDGYIDTDDVPKEDDCLKIRGLSLKRYLYCSFPDEYKATIRILNEDGTVAVEPFEANGGMMAIPVKGLKSGKNYYVQYKTTTGGNFAFNLM